MRACTVPRPPQAPRRPEHADTRFVQEQEQDAAVERIDGTSREVGRRRRAVLAVMDKVCCLSIRPAFCACCPLSTDCVDHCARFADPAHDH